MALSPAFLDELRARTTLSSVIMRTDKLQRAGREWKACCPFHDEKTPSFTVNDAKGFYHCFGCGAHGDVIRWMTDQRGMQFLDAVKELAAEAGLEMPAPDPQAAKRAEQRATLIDVTEAAQQWYVDQLASPSGKAARDYLASRGFSSDVCREFGFGYAPETRQALKQGLDAFDEAMLVEAGMRIEADGRDNYDRFRERLMLPIQDQRGRVIAFGGRILIAQDGVAKYLNSPDTPLFDKGRTLYNLHRAAPASRKTDRMVVVEGYMDVVALANAGIADAVAPLGTALTEAQIELLWRQVDAPILCFDGDAAGQRAAMRAVERAMPLLRPGKTLRIVQLPAGLDPDDLLKRDGTDALTSLFERASPLVDFLWEAAVAELDGETPEAKASIQERLFEQVQTILDPDIRALYRKAVSNRFYKFKNAAFRGTFEKHFNASSNVGTDTGPVSGNLVYWADNPGAYMAHRQRRLGAAIAAGIMLYPETMAEYAETLSSIDPSTIDDRLDFYINEMTDLDVELSCTAIMSSLRENGLVVPVPKEWDELAFPFTYQSDTPVEARRTLALAIELYCSWPQISRGIDRAVRAFDGPDATDAYDEQARLRTRRDEMQDACLAMLREAQERSLEAERTAEEEFA